MAAAFLSGLLKQKLLCDSRKCHWTPTKHWYHIHTYIHAYIHTYMTYITTQVKGAVYHFSFHTERYAQNPLIVQVRIENYIDTYIHTYILYIHTYKLMKGSNVTV